MKYLCAIAIFLAVGESMPHFTDKLFLYSISKNFQGLDIVFNIAIKLQNKKFEKIE